MAKKVKVGVIGCGASLSKIGYNTDIIKIQTGTDDSHGNGDAVLGKSLADTILEGKAAPTALKDGLEAAIVCLAIEDACRSGQVVSMKKLWELVDRG